MALFKRADRKNRNVVVSARNYVCSQCGATQSVASDRAVPVCCECGAPMIAMAEGNDMPSDLTERND